MTLGEVRRRFSVPVFPSTLLSCCLSPATCQSAGPLHFSLTHDDVLRPESLCSVCSVLQSHSNKHLMSTEQGVFIDLECHHLNRWLLLLPRCYRFTRKVTLLNNSSFYQPVCFRSRKTLAFLFDFLNYVCFLQVFY